MLHDVKAPRNGSPNANRKLQSSPQQPRRGSPSRQPTKQVKMGSWMRTHFVIVLFLFLLQSVLANLRTQIVKYVYLIFGQT